MHVKEKFLLFLINFVLYCRNNKGMYASMNLIEKELRQIKGGSFSLGAGLLIIDEIVL
jgi:hypothetical protein